MILPAFAPVLAFAQALLSTGSADKPQAPPFPGHTLYPLNDGGVIPSPAFGVGSALYQRNATGDVVLALSNGYRHLDNARIYGNERSVGEAIRLSGVNRSELYITTKYDAIDGESVREEFTKSLKDLGVDYVDLYLIHFPKFAVEGGGIAKVWAEFEALKEEGLAKSIGVSNYGVEELTELLALSKIKPAVNQIRYHAYNALQMLPLIELSNANGIVTEAYSALTPLTRLPGGKAVPVAERVARRLGVEVGQAILDWLKTKGVVAVTTSSKEERQKQQLEVFQEGFPAWTAKEIIQFETAAPGWEGKV